NMVHTAHELYSKFVEMGVDPNSYLNGSPASMPHIGSLVGIAKNIIQDAQSNSGIPPHHWVTQVFEITKEEWNVLQPSEQRDLVILAARVMGANNDVAHTDPDTKPFNVPEINPEFNYPYGFATLWQPPEPMFLFQSTESMRQLQQELLGRCRRAGER